MGREGRLSVALGRETPLHQSPQARVPLRHIEKERSIVAGQADRFGSGNACPYTSKRIFVGAETVTDKNILSPNSDCRLLFGLWARREHYI